MVRRSTRKVEKRHTERMAALDQDLDKEQFYTALESARWILGDRTVPPDMRLAVTLKEVRALLGIGRTTEAAVRLCSAVHSMHRYQLYAHRVAVEQMIGMVECAREPGRVGHVGC